MTYVFYVESNKDEVLSFVPKHALLDGGGHGCGWSEVRISQV